MQRLSRLSLNAEQQNVLVLFQQFVQIREMLTKHLPPSTVNLFAKPVVKTDNVVEWYTPLQGQPQFVQDKDLSSNIKALIDQKISSLRQLLAHLKNLKVLSGEQLAILEKTVDGLSTSERQIYLVNNEPVIVGWGLGTMPTTAPVVASTVTAVPVNLWAKHRCCWLALLLGLLVLLVGLGWWLLKPLSEIKPVEPLVKVAGQPIVPEQSKSEFASGPELEPKIDSEKVTNPKGKEVALELPKEEVKVEEPKITIPPKPVQVCNKNIETTKRPQVVLVFDNSRSMLLSLLESQQSLKEAFQRAALNGGFSDAEYDYLNREPSRLTVAKKSATNILDRIDKSLDIALLTLDSCPDAINYGFYSPVNRRILKKKVQELYPEDYNLSGTPLYSGLAQAADMVDGVSRNAFILLISDGEDSCGYGQNLCELAVKIAKKKPKLKINVVDIGNASAANCVASVTKGKIFTANSKTSLVRMVNQAIQPMVEKEVCE